MPDLAGSQIEERPGRDGLRAVIRTRWGGQLRARPGPAAGCAKHRRTELRITGEPPEDPIRNLTYPILRTCLE